MKVKECPYCGAKNKVQKTANAQYHCLECDTYFDDNDIEFEGLRHAISPLLIGTTEDNPYKFNAIIGRTDAVGLSDNELPQVNSAFHDQECKIWFNIYGFEEPVEFDDLDVEDLKEIYYELEKQYYQDHV